MTQPRAVVAVVDDDPRVLESLESLLESAGYEARSFPSARSLLLDGLSDFDVLITDIGMPGMDGFQLRELVKEARRDVPVFMITGGHDIPGGDQAEGIGRLFRKPFDAQILLAAIADALATQKNGGRT